MTYAQPQSSSNNTFTYDPSRKMFKAIYVRSNLCNPSKRFIVVGFFFFKLLGCVQHHYQRFDVLVVRYNNYLNILLHFNTLDLFNLVFKFYKENIKSFGSLLGWSLMATSVGSQTIRLGMTGQSWCTLK